MELKEKQSVAAQPKAAPAEAAQPAASEKQPHHANGDQQRHFDNKAGGHAPKGDRRFSRGGRGRDREYQEKVVAINRVAKTVKGGKKIRFSALVAIGDGKGNIGFATGKANEVPDAIKKALEAAKKEMFRVSVSKGETIPHETSGKYGACKVFLKPAPEGTGVIAGGPVRAIMELAGIKNIYSKVYGSRASINVVRATCNGLKGLKTATKVAALRGKSIEDLVGKKVA